MLQPIINYANDAAGIEKTLRGLQGFVTIAIGLAQAHQHENVDVLVKLRAQFALGRRYFRLLKWHPCWQNALRAAHTTPNHNTSSSKAPQQIKGRRKDHLKRTLEVLKFAFLGMYFFLEMFTITNALNITAYKWGPTVQLEANKCWFYSISISIGLCFYDNWILPRPVAASSSKQDQDQNHQPPMLTPARRVWSLDPESRSQLIIDCADLIVPGAAVGWIPVGAVTVGIASTISTVITGREIWGRVQRDAACQKQVVKQVKQE